MMITSPCEITSRLLPGLRVADGTISIEYAKRQNSARIRYRWYIDIPAGEFTGDDLQSGCGPANLQSGLESLLSFLAACGESFAYDQRRGGDGGGGDNSDLFPKEVAEWAAQNQDELSTAQIELSETDGIIVE